MPIVFHNGDLIKISKIPLRYVDSGTLLTKECAFEGIFPLRYVNSGTVLGKWLGIWLRTMWSLKFL
jgi:hypothetical protein